MVYLLSTWSSNKVPVVAPMRYLNQLKPRDYLILVLIITLVRIWLIVDQNFIPSGTLRIIAFITIVFFLLTGFYSFAKPVNIFLFSTNLSLILLVIAVLLSVLQHLVLHQDFDIYFKQVIIIWVTVVTLPYITAIIYKLTKINKQDK